LHGHENLPVKKCVEILKVLKPSYIHHPLTKELIQLVLGAFGCSPPVSLTRRIATPGTRRFYLPSSFSATDVPVLALSLRLSAFIDILGNRGKVGNPQREGAAAV
jgi:hypothetical protein